MAVVKTEYKEWRSGYDPDIPARLLLYAGPHFKDVSLIARVGIETDAGNMMTKVQPPPGREDLKTHYLRGEQYENERKKRCRYFKRR